jgi:alpha-1,3-glucan synthase
MGDLIGFKGYLNESTPFDLQEHNVLWKSSRRYLDFDIGNNYLDKCEYPRFWLETGEPVGRDVTDRMIGCYDSEFDQVSSGVARRVSASWVSVGSASLSANYHRILVW